MKKLKILINTLIKEPKKLILIIASKGLLRWLPDKMYLKLIFKIRVGYKLSFTNPVTFNQKIQWLKVYDHNPLYTKLVDKFEVRNHINSILGEEYLIPLIATYEKFDEIDFNLLPNQFVLKTTHDSGGVVICKDKRTFNHMEAKRKINKSLKRNYFYQGREWPYKNVKPQIICEKYMEDETNNELRDYKFMCFNGKVKCEFVCLNRNKPTGLNVDFYDLNWQPMPFERHYSSSGEVIPRPQNFNKMIEFSEKLSKEIPFLRVDFYEIKNQIYLGELTFYPGSGFEEFEPEIYDSILGSWLQLPTR